MKVHVDEERCEGHGRCYALAPARVRARRPRQRPGHRRRHRRPRRGRPSPPGGGQLPRAGHHDRRGRLTMTQRSDDHPPVQDWATDFDHTDEVYAADPFPIWDEIRASGCPIAHTERYGGAWLPTSHEDVVRDRLRHRALHVAQRRDVAVPAAARDGAGRASRRRSRPTRRSTSGARRAAPARLRAAGHRQARAVDARLLRGAHRRRWATATSSTPPRSTPSTSPCGSSRRCSGSPRRTPIASAASSTTCSRASPSRSRSAPRG